MTTRTSSSPRTCATCGKSLNGQNKTGLCSIHAGPVYRARHAAKAQQQRLAAPSPPPAAVVTPPGPVTSPAPTRRLAVCPKTPDGRHRLQRFGGLRLPGQAEDYCVACQPRPALPPRHVW